MNQADIETGFAKKLAAFVVAPDDNGFQWSFTDGDMSEEPMEGKPYIRGTSIMGDPYNASIAGGSGVFSRQVGFYQATLNFPQNKEAPRKMREYAEKIRRLFWDGGPTGTFTEAGTEIDIYRMPKIDRLPSKGVYIKCCVDIYFRVEDGPV